MVNRDGGKGESEGEEEEEREREREVGWANAKKKWKERLSRKISFPLLHTQRERRP